MSNTPRTDALVIVTEEATFSPDVLPSWEDYCAIKDHARQLERELFDAIVRAENAEAQNLWRKFIRLLEIVEETDDGVPFRPNSIQSCRALDGMQMQSIIERAKALYTEPKVL